MAAATRNTVRSLGSGRSLVRPRPPADKRAGKNRRRKNVRGTRAEILVGAQRRYFSIFVGRHASLPSVQIRNFLGERKPRVSRHFTKILPHVFFLPDGTRGGSVVRSLVDVGESVGIGIAFSGVDSMNLSRG